MYLEAAAMLPQIFMFQKQAGDQGGVVEVHLQLVFWIDCGAVIVSFYLADLMFISILQNIISSTYICTAQSATPFTDNINSVYSIARPSLATRFSLSDSQECSSLSFGWDLFGTYVCETCCIKGSLIRSCFFRQISRRKSVFSNVWLSRKNSNYYHSSEKKLSLLLFFLFLFIFDEYIYLTVFKSPSKNFGRYLLNF